jgi:hypothetical protein
MWHRIHKVMIEYSDNLLRGLSADDWVKDGIVTASAFQIKFEPTFMRNDCAANSISWEDDTSVVELMMQQKKKENGEQNDKLQYKVGLARIPRKEVDHIMRLPTIKDILSYEREPLPDNKYHGNLLVRPESSLAQRKLLPGVIACLVSEIIPRT